MMKRMILLLVIVLLAAVLAGGNAHAGKLYAVSASAEPSNAVLYRYDITGPNDHRCEAIDPSTGWSQPELILPILPSEVQQTSPLSGGWPQRSPGALTVSPWGEMFVFDRGYGGNGAGAAHRFLDPTGPSPQYNGTIDARSLGLNSDFRTFHWGSFRNNELYVAERYGVVTRILFDQNHTASYNGQISVYPGSDSTRSAQVTPWGEVFVGFAYSYGPINRYLIASNGADVPNGVLGGTTDCSFWGIHDMVFSPSGDMFVTSGMSSIVRVRFDANWNATCSVVAADSRLDSTIAVAYAPWGELFVSNHLRNEVTRWLDSGNGPLTYNGTIYTPVGPVWGFWGPVAGIGDIEFVTDPIIHVTIDITPGSFPNSISPASRGVIPVAILTTGTFNAAIVDAQTVRFGPAGAPPASFLLQDVDLDGDLDLVLQFRTQQTGIVCGTTSATLTGKTLAGHAITGTDSVNTVGCR